MFEVTRFKHDDVSTLIIVKSVVVVVVLSHFIRGNEHSFNEYTFSGHTYPLLGYLYHTHTHAPNATGIMWLKCNQQDKSDGDL